MPRGKRHTEEVRAQVMAALLAGQGVAEIAVEYQLPESTVKTWAYSNDQFDEVRQQKRVELDDLITEYVREVFTTLSVQARHFRGAAWLDKQRGTEAAVLHGVLADKAIRILAAAAQPDSTDVGTPPGASD